MELRVAKMERLNPLLSLGWYYARRAEVYVKFDLGKRVPIGEFRVSKRLDPTWDFHPNHYYLLECDERNGFPSKQEAVAFVEAAYELNTNKSYVEFVEWLGEKNQSALIGMKP